MQSEELAEPVKGAEQTVADTPAAVIEPVPEEGVAVATDIPHDSDQKAPADPQQDPPTEPQPVDPPAPEQKPPVAEVKELLAPQPVPEAAEGGDNLAATTDKQDSLQVGEASPDRSRSNDASASVSPEKNKSAPAGDDESGTKKKGATGTDAAAGPSGTGTAKAATSSTKEKLKALEDKYKEKLKENAAQKDEIAKLTKILFEVYREVGIQFDEPSEYKLGEHGTATFLKKTFGEGWQVCQKKQTSHLKQSVDEALAAQQKTHEEELTRLQKQAAEDAASKQQQLTDLMAKSSKQISQKQQEEALENMREGYERSLRNLEELNAKIQRDYTSLLGTLRTKEDEIGQLRAKNLELSNKAADSLMQRFEEIDESDISAHLQRSSRTDEFIRLKNELEAAQVKIDELEAQRAASQGKSGQQGGLKKSDADYTEQSTQTDGGHDDPQRKSFSGKSNGLFHQERLEDKLEREMVLSQKKEEENISSGYFKDLVVRYMVFEAKRNEQECNVLRRAILDFLKVDSSARALIDEAVTGKGGLMDSINILKYFGSGS